MSNVGRSSVVLLNIPVSIFDIPYPVHGRRQRQLCKVTLHITYRLRTSYLTNIYSSRMIERCERPLIGNYISSLPKQKQCGRSVWKIKQSMTQCGAFFPSPSRAASGSRFRETKTARCPTLVHLLTAQPAEFYISILCSEKFWSRLKATSGTTLHLNHITSFRWAGCL